MNRLRIKNKMFIVIFVAGSLFGMNVYASDTGGLAVYDEAVYTAEVEKSMHKMHGLYLRAYDKSLSKSEKAKAKKEYYKIAQTLVRNMHQRVMNMNIKEGAALSHTDVLLSTHMTMMLLDMLAAEQLAK